MAYRLIRADALALLVADDPVVAVGEVAMLREADGLLAEARHLRDDVAARVEVARGEGWEAGRVEGEAAGRAAAADATRAELFTLAMRAAAERAQVRGEVAALALQVVRRIAGEVGPAAMVAGLAETAARQLLPETVATVRVPPTATGAAIARLGAFPSLTVLGDDSLADDDCVIETPLGVTRAGLETQLAAVARAWETGDGG